MTIKDIYVIHRTITLSTYVLNNSLYSGLLEFKIFNRKYHILCILKTLSWHYIHIGKLLKKKDHKSKDKHLLPIILLKISIKLSINIKHKNKHSITSKKANYS